MFYFRLAQVLGKTVSQLLSELDSVEISEWKAVDRLSPLDHARRAELSAATIAMLFHNAHISSSGDAKSAAYFMNDWGKAYREQVETEKQTLDEKLDFMMQRFVAMAQGK